MKLDDVISKRRVNAQFYFNNLNSNYIKLPVEKEHEFNTYHTFTIQIYKRDALSYHLKENDIKTAIHYSIPIHLQPAASKLGYKKGDFPMAEHQSDQILSLPIHQYLTETDLKLIVKTVNGFFD